MIAPEHIGLKVGFRYWMLLIMLMLGAVLTACDRQSPNPSVTKQTPFQEASALGDVVPLASGGAYLVSANGIFYVRDEKAAAVSGLPRGLLFPELYPLADGSAILRDIRGTQLYLLRGVKATSIVEMPGFDPKLSAAAPFEGFLFAENQRLRNEIKQLNDQSFDLSAEVEPEEQQ